MPSGRGRRAIRPRYRGGPLDSGHGSSAAARDWSGGPGRDHDRGRSGRDRDRHRNQRRRPGRERAEPDPSAGQRHRARSHSRELDGDAHRSAGPNSGRPDSVALAHEFADAPTAPVSPWSAASSSTTRPTARPCRSRRFPGCDRSLIGGRAYYYALAGNRYNLKIGSYAGEFRPEVTMQQAGRLDRSDGRRRRRGTGRQPSDRGQAGRSFGLCPALGRGSARGHQIDRTRRWTSPSTASACTAGPTRRGSSSGSRASCRWSTSFRATPATTCWWSSSA